MTIADSQPILWYFEKRPYGELGARKSKDISYEEAASAVVRDGTYRSDGRDLVELEEDPDERADKGNDADRLSIDRPDAAGDRRAGGLGAEPDQAGRVDVVGTHYSRQQRQVLDGRMYGTGLRGAETERLQLSSDPRLLERVYMYLDEGQGNRPVAGVGGYAHRIDGKKLYDMSKDLQKLSKADANAMESAILDAGFDGYHVPKIFNRQGVAVIIGPASRGVAVTPLATGERSAGVIATADAKQAPRWKTWATASLSRWRWTAPACTSGTARVGQDQHRLAHVRRPAGRGAARGRHVEQPQGDQQLAQGRDGGRRGTGDDGAGGQEGGPRSPRDGV